MSVEDPLELSLLKVRYYPMGQSLPERESKPKSQELERQSSNNVMETLETAFPTGIISISLFSREGEFDSVNYIELKLL